MNVNTTLVSDSLTLPYGEEGMRFMIDAYQGRKEPIRVTPHKDDYFKDCLPGETLEVDLSCRMLMLHFTDGYWDIVQIPYPPVSDTADA